MQLIPLTVNATLERNKLSLQSPRQLIFSNNSAKNIKYIQIWNNHDVQMTVYPEITYHQKTQVPLFHLQPEDVLRISPHQHAILAIRFSPETLSYEKDLVIQATLAFSRNGLADTIQLQGIISTTNEIIMPVETRLLSKNPLFSATNAMQTFPKASYQEKQSPYQKKQLSPLPTPTLPTSRSVSKEMTQKVLPSRQIASPKVGLIDALQPDKWALTWPSTTLNHRSVKSLEFCNNSQTRTILFRVCIRGNSSFDILSTRDDILLSPGNHVSIHLVYCPTTSGHHHGYLMALDENGNFLEIPLNGKSAEEGAQLTFLSQTILKNSIIPWKLNEMVFPISLCEIRLYNEGQSEATFHAECFILLEKSVISTSDSFDCFPEKGSVAQKEICLLKLRLVRPWRHHQSSIIEDLRLVITYQSKLSSMASETERLEMTVPWKTVLSSNGLKKEDTLFNRVDHPAIKTLITPINDKLNNNHHKSNNSHEMVKINTTSFKVFPSVVEWSPEHLTRHLVLSNLGSSSRLTTTATANPLAFHIHLSSILTSLVRITPADVLTEGLMEVPSNGFLTVQMDLLLDCFKRKGEPKEEEDLLWRKLCDLKDDMHHFVRHDGLMKWYCGDLTVNVNGSPSQSIQVFIVHPRLQSSEERRRQGWPEIIDELKTVTGEEMAMLSKLHNSKEKSLQMMMVGKEERKLEKKSDKKIDKHGNAPVHLQTTTLVAPPAFMKKTSNLTVVLENRTSFLQRCKLVPIASACHHLDEKKNGVNGKSLEDPVFLFKSSTSETSFMMTSSLVMVLEPFEHRCVDLIFQPMMAGHYSQSFHLVDGDFVYGQLDVAATALNPQQVQKRIS